MTETVTVHPEGIDLREAIKAAKEFLLGLEKDGLVAGPIKDVVLEEVQNIDSGGEWLITLGYRIPTPFDSAFSSAALAGLRAPRSEFYKTFRVDRHTGRVTSMSLREPRRD